MFKKLAFLFFHFPQKDPRKLRKRSPLKYYLNKFKWLKKLETILINKKGLSFSLL